ncbi:hypothetical protein [Cyanobium sp. CH-040]|uniref:hypothetical protein n=1 Tax=Cyanobium sp. CH-040 TaxID=2823708 RepID=UPI0020CC6565|nr:hypothetical protein [Cyanobium sp. CH-040]MCP9928152.1 hypothetical protein [Cyanobium sp. CH-040]
MSITHCPLCVALAVLSAVRGLSHAVLLWQLLAAGRGSAQGLGGFPRLRLSLRLS